MIYADPKSWASLMGCDLEKADLQSLEPLDDGARIRVGGNGEERTLPLVIEEHPADILGPRFVDELQGDCVVRHAIPGLSRDEWDAEGIRELERLLCAQPFRMDPVAAIADGHDWVGWMTRNRVLEHPAPDDETLRTRLIDTILGRQSPDGSWGAVPATAFAILNLLALGEGSSDARIISAKL